MWRQYSQNNFFKTTTECYSNSVGYITRAIGQVTQYLTIDLPDGEKFDYIVVGAGAAGAAVSARLVLAGNDVLLIEAGGDPNLLTKVKYTYTFQNGTVVS